MRRCYANKSVSENIHQKSIFWITLVRLLAARKRLYPLIYSQQHGTCAEPKWYLGYLVWRQKIANHKKIMGDSVRFLCQTADCRAYRVFGVSLGLAFNSAFSFFNASFSASRALMVEFNSRMKSLMRRFNMPICCIAGDASEAFCF
jgi:hypothetical protein